MIRYNEIWSTEDHGFNDAIGGGSNYTLEGSPNRDSDIYGNLIDGWDDAIESEGANMNVRIWGNYRPHLHALRPRVLRAVRSISFAMSGARAAARIGTRSAAHDQDRRARPLFGGRRRAFHNTARPATRGVQRVQHPSGHQHGIPEQYIRLPRPADLPFAAATLPRTWTTTCSPGST